MYTRSERTPTPLDRLALGRLQTDNRAAGCGCGAGVVLLGGVLALKGFELYLDQWSGSWLDNRVACWLTVALFAFLSWFPLAGLVRRRRERRHLLATLAGDTVIEERVEAGDVVR